MANFFDGWENQALPPRKKKKSYVYYQNPLKWNTFIIGLRKYFDLPLYPGFLRKKVKPHFTYPSSFFRYSSIPINVMSKNDWRKVPNQSPTWVKVRDLPEND